MVARLAKMFFVAIILVVAVSLIWDNASGLPPDVVEVLDLAGDNEAELQKVLDHYTASGDSLKLEAALFLIGNMDGHCFVTYYLHDTADNEVELDPLSFPDYDSLKAYCHTIESERGEIDYARKDRFDDCEHITADFLIKHIDDAFLAWQSRPWSAGYDFEQFCNYILPYRGSNEPLELWREHFISMYDGLAESMTDSTDPVEAAALINSDIRDWFKFDPRYYFHPTDQGLAEMLESELGRCEDMTNITIYALRANGIPVTSDYTPHWANTGNNHAWNSIVLPDGKVIPFMGAEANPGKYKLNNKFAKIYRKMFAHQRGNLTYLDNSQESVPRWLGGKNYSDVTEGYIITESFTVNFTEPVPDSIDFVYICVFNSGKWCPIDWAAIQRTGEEASALFNNVAPGVIVLPAFYINEEVTAAALPLVVGSDDVLIDGADHESSVPMELSFTTKEHFDTSTRGVHTMQMEEGKTYELSYWDGEWVSVASQTVVDGMIAFEDVPGNALYWLVAEDSDKEERIFTIDPETGEQVWW